MISAQFYIMPGRYERVCVRWHYAKVKGHAELKIEKSQSKDLYLRFPQITKIEKSKGRPRSPCAPNMVQFRPLFPELQHFGKKMPHAIFFRSAAILKVLVRPNWFSNLSEPRVKESRHANFGAIQAIFLQLSWSQHKLAHSCQGRGQRSNGAINRNKHLFRSFCRGISNLVTPSLTVAELFQKEGRK